MKASQGKKKTAPPTEQIPHVWLSETEQYVIKDPVNEVAKDNDNKQSLPMDFPSYSYLKKLHSSKSTNSKQAFK